MQENNCNRSCIFEICFVACAIPQGLCGISLKKEANLTREQHAGDVKKLAAYLKEVRTKLDLSTNYVSDESKRRYPKNRQRQISFAYLCSMERGEVMEFSPLKLKTLAEIYGQDYLYLLYLSGILPENTTIDAPMTELQKLVYDELIESGLFVNAARSKTMGKIDPKTRNALRKAVRIAAKTAIETILNSE